MTPSAAGGIVNLPWLCLYCHAPLTDAAARTHACCPASVGDGPAGIVRGLVGREVSQ